MKGDLARRAFAKEMSGAPSESSGAEPADDLEASGEAIMGKAIRKALAGSDDAALCRAVRDAAGGASEPAADMGELEDDYS